MKYLKFIFLGLISQLMVSKLSAQCPTSITALNSTIGNNGTATITPLTTGTTNPMFTTNYWQVSPNTVAYNQAGEFQFFSNSTYSVCLTISDSLNGCMSNQYCTTVAINNIVPGSCHAGFYAFTDSSCVTHFNNTSTGNGISFRWIINGMSFYSTNPSVSLSNGSYPVILETYYNGQVCDTAFQTVSVGCNGTNTLSCSSDFTYYTDSSCVTHLIQTSTGNNLSYEWYSASFLGNTLLSTAPNPTLNLPAGNNEIQLATFSNGAFCDSAVYVIPVACPGATGNCVAVSQFQVFADSLNPMIGHYYAYNTSYGSGAMSYLWNFGDGTSSTQQYPFHQYAIPGQYVICLTVTSSQGTVTCSDVYCDSSSVQKSTSFLMSQMNVIPQIIAGVKETPTQVMIDAFPNPISDSFTIKTDFDNGFHFQIWDAIGRKVADGKSIQPSLQLNSQLLSNGFYSLLISNKNGDFMRTIKLIK